ncbi:unnamed protein product [Gongylonema pulchrum]|uniref:FERM domain-containing protein n=1 Tax=Gongylonema pulchrum TaxID=637853 RepID=A0A183DF28_9BILA|nr:unnamed protein product [Gongylonema pulchrum]
MVEREECHDSDPSRQNEYELPLLLRRQWGALYGDPCTISSQRELDEAVRLLHANGEAELNVHVFLGIPPLPGLPCNGEDSMSFTLPSFVVFLFTAYLR